MGDTILANQRKDQAEKDSLEALGPGLVDIVWDRLDSIRHILVATFFAYFIGYFGFHLFWVAILFYFVYSLDAQYKMRGFQHFYRLKKLKTAERKQVPREENASWFNFLMLAVWPNISNRVAVETKRFMSAFIEEQLTAMQPPSIHGVYMRNITFGKIPPQIKLLRPMPMDERYPSRYVLDVTVHYAGELEVTIVAIVGVKGIKAKVPVTLENIKLTAEMQIVLDFFPENPYVRSLDIAFRDLSHDWLDFNVKVLGGLSVLSLPAIKDWVMNTITVSIRETMMLPKTVHVNLAGDEEDQEGSANSVKEKKHTYAVPLKQGEPNPFVSYKGHVKVTLVEARNLLKTDRVGSTDAYVKLSVNDVWYKSQVIPNTLNPVWNTTYEIPLENRPDEQVLKLKIKDWDSTGKNDIQGSVEIKVTEMKVGGFFSSFFFLLLSFPSHIVSHQHSLTCARKFGLILTTQLCNKKGRSTCFASIVPQKTLPRRQRFSKLNE